MVLEQQIQQLEDKIIQMDSQRIPYPLDSTSQTILNRLIQRLIDIVFPIRFGGDGSDGDLFITSGTTTIDLASASFVIRNYRAISITGTGALAFSNPATNGTIVILKSKRDVILTSTAAAIIDTRSLGGIGGTGVDVGSTPANPGEFGISAVVNTNSGAGGVRGGASGGAGGSGGTAILYVLQAIGKTIRVSCGAGGGAGGNLNDNNTGAGGSGGRGGGGLIIECGNGLNFTGTINASGANGSNAVAAGTNFAGSGGGGGGGGGVIAILYKTLITNTGTLTTNGGNGGNGAAGNGNQVGGTGAGGGGGGANRFVGGAGGAGGDDTPTAGSAGATGGGTGGGTGGTGGAASAGSAGGGGGGGGSAGNSYVIENTEF